MPRFVPIIATLGLVLTIAGPSAAREPADKPPAPNKDVNSCALVTANVRAEAFGYTHTVELKNNCERSVECEVWTDVDPTPRQTLRAEPGGSDVALTRRGAPSREVRAEKSCRFK